MPTNHMLGIYKHRDKTFVDRLWINPENIEMKNESQLCQREIDMAIVSFSIAYVEIEKGLFFIICNS
jgi:hypothetical protein